MENQQSSVSGPTETRWLHFQKKLSELLKEESQHTASWFTLQCSQRLQRKELKLQEVRALLEKLNTERSALRDEITKCTDTINSLISHDTEDETTFTNTLVVHNSVVSVFNLDWQYIWNSHMSTPVAFLPVQDAIAQWPLDSIPLSSAEYPDLITTPIPVSYSKEQEKWYTTMSLEPLSKGSAALHKCMSLLNKPYTREWSIKNMCHQLMHYCQILTQKTIPAR